MFEKDEARFEVELSRPAKSFRWLKGSQELQSDEKYHMIQEGNLFLLSIRSAAYEDEAKYIFEAEDKRTSSKLVIQGTGSFFAFLNATATKEARQVDGDACLCLWQESV